MDTALTTTLPLTLTGTLPAVPDAATGLVHLGGGRWYDPALGRPLQPNAAGGPPTVPQALNRYAATPLGQPGVAAAEYQRSASSRVSLQQYLLNTAKNETIEGVLGTGVGKGVAAYAEAPVKGRLIVPALRIKGFLRAGYGSAFTNNVSGLYTSELLEQLSPTTYRALDSGLIINAAIVRSARFHPRLGFDEGGLKRVLGTEFGEELLASTVVEVAFAIPDIVEIWGNPYFTRSQQWTQTAFTGAKVMTAVGFGAWAATSPALAAYPPLLIGVVAGVTVEVAFEYAIKPGVSWVYVNVFNASDPFQDIRQLAPLGGGGG